MDFSNGEIERLVKTLNPEETNDIVIQDVLMLFIEQSLGIQNRVFTVLSSHLSNYGKNDVKRLFKTTTQQVCKINEDDETKTYLLIADEVLTKFNIITLKTDQFDDRRPIMMVFYNNSYHTDISQVEQFISNRIRYHNVGHKHTFSDTIHFIQKQTLFDPDLLNYDDKVMVFKNGVYDFRANKFVVNKEPQAWHYFYEITHDYKNNKEYDCPKFKKALISWIDKKTTPYHRKGKRIILLNDIFEAIGLWMTTHMGFRSDFILYGEPGCGKSQFFNIIIRVIGKPNISHTSLQRLGKNEFGAEGMAFKTLNYCGDLPSSRVLDTGLYKSMSGGDTSIESERKGGTKHNIRPTNKFCFNANKVPKLGNWDDTATYERFIMIPFVNKFPELDEMTIKNFWKIIVEDSNEIQGIIHEAIKGFKRLLERNGFRKILKKDTRHIWNYTSNKFYAFVYDYCNYNPKSKILRSEFWDKYWEAMGMEEGKSSITIGLRKLNIPAKDMRIPGTNDHDWFYLGIEWKSQNVKEDVNLNYTIDKDFSDVGGIGYEF